MKNICATLSVVLVILFSVTAAYTENTVDVSAFADGVLKNRLFEISIVAQPQSSICAGELTLSYDNSVVEFREVNSDSYFVEAKDSKGEVNIIFGSAYCDESAENELLKVQFKALSEGTFNLELACFSFVDEELNTISVNAHDAQIMVNKTSVKSKSNKESKKEEIAQSSESGSGSVSTTDELFVHHGEENRISVFFIICIFLAVVVAFLLGVLFSRKSVVAEDDDDEMDDR